MNPNDREVLGQLDSLLAANHQSWLFGAGISRDAKIPLMGGLTDRVFVKALECCEKDEYEVLDQIRTSLSIDAHIEHVLSQLGDYRSIADRSRDHQAVFGKTKLSINQIDDLHQKILNWISETIRWGYKPQDDHSAEEIGNSDKPIVLIENHLAFFTALLKRSQAGVAERRVAVKLFTTNYDTLIEDALALSGFSYWDGFSGGAVAYRNHRYGDELPSAHYRAMVIKLHGSIDWHLTDDDRVLRVRDRDLYPNRVSRVLIYPQSTKYLATQRDPFAAQFDLFRRALGMREENVLVTCGYSFGDEHINQEIELALQRPENKSTLLAFASGLNPTLDKWRNSHWGKRLYVISKKGIYVGAEDPISCSETGSEQNWWTFDGVTKLLNGGAESCAL